MEKIARAGMSELQTIKQHLRKLQWYIESHSALYLFISVIFYGLLAASSWLNIYETLTPGWTSGNTQGVFLLIIAALLLVDYKHMVMLNNRKKEIIKRDKLLTAMKEAMRFQTDRIEVPYVNKHLHWDFDIKRNGDGNCIRESVISPINKPVYLFTIFTGAVGESPGIPEMKLSSDGGLGFHVKRHYNGRNMSVPLLHYRVKDGPRSKRHCIVLDSELSVGETATVVAEYQWPGLWLSLLENGKDEGLLRVEHDMQFVELIIRAPAGYEITGFTNSPNIGLYNISKSKDKRSLLRWTACDLKKGTNLHYQVFAHKNQ